MCSGVIEVLWVSHGCYIDVMGVAEVLCVCLGVIEVLWVS